MSSIKPDIDFNNHEDDLSAAARAYKITYIRQQILHHLPRGSLARFMRVQREAVSDVARNLYRTYKDSCMKYILSSGSVSRGLPSSVVTHQEGG